MNRWIAALCALLVSLGTAVAAVNANTASADDLQAVPGIGPAIAQRIVTERRNGPFKSLDDLQARVKGVGESSIRKMAAGGLTVGPSRAATGKPESTTGAKAVPKAAPKAEAPKAGARP